MRQFGCVAIYHLKMVDAQHPANTDDHGNEQALLQYASSRANLKNLCVAVSVYDNQHLQQADVSAQ